MKKRQNFIGSSLAVLVLILVAIFSFTVSCTPAEEFESYEKQTTAEMELIQLNGHECIKIVEIRGHEYIIYYGYQAGGITHSASCSCQK